MKNRSKIISLLLIFTFMLGIFSTSVTAMEFTDMPEEGYWSRPALDKAVKNGLLKGDGGKIRSKDNLTRAQMATIINRAFGAEEKANISEYKDVSKDAWYYSEMQKASAMGTFKGSDGKMNPEDHITREQAFAVIIRALDLESSNVKPQGYKDLEDISSWARGEVYSIINNGYIKGSNGKINPKGKITREEFAQVMDNIIKEYIYEKGTHTSNLQKGNLMVNSSNVILENTTINGDLIIGDGAGRGEIILENVTVKGRVLVRGGNTLKVNENSVIDILKIKKDGVKVQNDGIIKDIIGAPEYPDSPEKSNLEIHFIDVGQGDSVLITKGSEAMLIDAGENNKGELVVDYIKKQGIEKLDYVIGTHPHSDHIGGLDDVIDNFEIGKIIMPKVTHTTKTYEDVLNAIARNGLKITEPKVGDKYNLGESEFTIIAPNSEKYSNLNNYSVSFRLVNKNNSFVFTGDAEHLSEEEMVNNGLEISADILKLGHHGSNTSTTSQFLDKVNPTYAIVQVGEGNSYGHPDREVLDRLENKNIKVYRNDLHGTVKVISNGDSINISTEKKVDMDQLKLEEAKIEAKKELDNFVNKNDYKEYNLSILELEIAAGKNAIDNADSLAKVANLLNNSKESIGKIKTDKEVEAEEVESQEGLYIGNINSKVFHKKVCRSLPNPENREYLKNREEAISKGYRACGICKP